MTDYIAKILVRHYGPELERALGASGESLKRRVAQVLRLIAAKSRALPSPFSSQLLTSLDEPNKAYLAILAYVSALKPEALAVEPELAQFFGDKHVSALVRRLAQLLGAPLPIVRALVAVRVFQLKRAVKMVYELLGGPGKGYTGVKLSPLVLEKILEDAAKLAAAIDYALRRARYENPLFEKIAQKTASIAKYIIQAGESTQPFGVVTGVRTMRSLEDIRDLTPTERGIIAYGHMLGNTPLGTAVRAYAAYRLTTKQALVYKRTIRVKPYIFIDFSGSMQTILPGGHISRYMAGAAIAIGIMNAVGFADIYLFNDYPYNISRLLDYDADKIRRALAGLLPGGGTSILNVLETIKVIERESRRHAGEKPYYIIITDAADYVPGSILKELKRMGVLDRTALIIIGNEREMPWVREFPHRARVRHVGSLDTAVKRVAEALVAAVTRPGVSG